MSLIHPAILYGLALGVVPVILHLLLRAKPKKLLFPALRLIQVRRRQNVRRMRLRHIWLMLLRVVVIVLLVLAIARPSLPAANYSFTWREWLVLLVIGGAAVGAYTGVVSRWKRRRLPHHTLAYRRTYLRAGSGVATALLVLLLVVWPYQRRIAAEVSSPLPKVGENVPVAAVFLFDTSPSVQYLQEGKTRLNVAKQVAIAHLERIPSRSRIAVGDTSTDNPLLFQAELVGARARIDALEIHAVSRSLDDRLRLALNLHDEDRRRTLDLQGSVPDDLRRDAFVREIYVFTDLARSAWQVGGSRTLKDELQRLPWVNVYLIDVGVTSPINVALSDLRLSTQTVPLGGSLFVEGAIRGTGVDNEERTVELLMKKNGGKLGQRTVKVSSQSAARFPFSVSGLTQPVNQGEIRLISSDPLPADDVLYFTVAVQPPPEVLVIAPSRDDAFYLLEALAPAELDRQGKSRYRCRFVAADKAADVDPARYSAVCLVDVASLPTPVWERLAKYVNGGGGVAVFLGSAALSGRRGVDAVSYNSSAAQTFLPAELVAALRFPTPEAIDLKDLTHPVLKKFEAFGGSAAGRTIGDVRRYWKVAVNRGASVIAPYTDSAAQPALLERPHGSGRTVMLTTGVSLKGWSDVPRSWQFLVLADQTVQYLSGRMESVFNYTVGDDVFLNLGPNETVPKLLLGKPGLQQLPIEAGRGGQTINVRGVDQLGHYEITAAEPESKFAAGFSANLPARESDFTRLTTADLDGLLGENRYSLARDIEGLTRTVTTGRLGQEVFPMLMLLLLIVFCGEHFVANRFYEAEQSVTK